MIPRRQPGWRRQLLSCLRLWCLLIVLQSLSSITIQTPTKTSSATTSTSYATTTSNFNILPVAEAWEWTDFVSASSINDGETATFLTKDEISNLRVRDLKRRLARTHGYSADELGKMLDKKELIRALWKEEYREQQKAAAKIKRQVLWQGALYSIVAVVVVVGWPVWKHVYEVGLVNWEVYTDRKKLEIQKCIQYKTFKGSIGVILMIVVDLLQFWLSATVLLSWVTTSKYFFPVPSLAIRPGQFMGEKVANGPMGRYGMNIAPMAVTWTLRFTRGHLESWTAKALSGGYQQQKRHARANETEEERAARKAARKAAKRAAKEEARLQEEERLQQEAMRRKEAAEQATSQLFGRRQPPPQHQEHQDRGNPFPSDEHNDENGDDAMEHDDEPETRREFEADLQDVDINDLD